MAFTNTIVKQSVFGDMRVILYEITADANSGVINTGLSYIYSVQATVKSAATNGQNFKANKNAAGAASNGDIMASSCANGQEFYLTVYGR
jgi:hypothetical protein